MIVVAIIGLLAALAIPAWQKVRSHSICTVMDNDARQLGAAAQQYYMESGVGTVPVGYVNGEITGPLRDRVRLLGRDYIHMPSTLGMTESFTMEHPLVPDARNYDAEGHYQP